MIQTVIVYVVAAVIYLLTRKEYPYYKAFQVGIVNICCYMLLWNETFLMWNQFYECLKRGDCETFADGMSVVLFIVMTAFTICFTFSYVKFPIAQFWTDYKSSNRIAAPRISYSLFKKMRKLQPDYFSEWEDHDGRLLHLTYHDILYRLSLPDYILAMLYIDREERRKTDTKQAERNLYAVMQTDLDKQLDSIVKDRNAALRSVEQATRKTQEILANMAGK